jgi:hypothetical protein
MNLSIRTATPADIPALTALIAASVFLVSMHSMHPERIWWARQNSNL